MFKKMKLAAKIGLGFGLLILIAVALGGLATYCMLNVKTTATELAQTNVPAVAVANNVERYSLKTMYEARGYAFAEEEAYLNNARKQLEEVKKYLKNAQELAAKTNNAVLDKNAKAAEAKAVEYEKLLNDTVAKTEAMDQDKVSLTKAAEAYMTECTGFLDNQGKKLNEEIDAALSSAAAPSEASANIAANNTNPAEKTSITAAALKERAMKLNLCNDVIDLGNTIRIGLWKSISQRDPKLFQETQKKFNDVNAKLDELKKITTQEANLKQIEACRAAGKAYSDGMNSFLNNWLAREELNKQRGAVGDAVLDAAKTTAETGMDDTAKSADAAAKSLNAASITMIVGLGVGAVIGIILALTITRSITGPINRIIAGLTEGSEQVASASAQVSAASQSLAEGSTEQAAGLQETSSSLEEMASMTKQNADNAQQANTLAGEARNAAEKGNEAMTRMSQAINEIQKSANETAKIIKVIDEIAFQTNLLALNAAVEAARAGEAGKGFAVVAEEVRNLAMRSAEAAKNTASMIEESVKNSQNGVNISTEVAKMLEEITGASRKVNDLVGEISAASQEQSRGIEQVNTAMSQMDKVTQQNAANAEESASASEEMNAQAEQMNTIVGELAALVGGAVNSTAKTGSVKTTKHVNVHVDHDAAKRVHELVGKKSGSKGKAKNVKLTHAAAEQAIPLEDASPENDFRDFNG